jgi:putative protease
VLIGTVDKCDGASFSLSVPKVFFADGITIDKGDRLRVQPKSRFEGIPCKAADCKITVDKMEITPSSPVKCDIGDHVFLIGKSEKSPPRKNIAIVAPPTKVLKTNFPNAQRIANSLNPPPPTDNTKIPKPKLWFKADKTEWLDILNASPCRHLIFDADISEINNFLDDPNLIKTWRSRISIALPPFIDEAKIKVWHKIVEKCLSAGLQSFTISNIGHFPLVKGTKQVTADALLWCLNRFTQSSLISCGVAQFIYSYEDEYLNIRDTAAPIGIAPIYGRPPLFISRMPTPVKCDTVLSDPHNNKFFVSAKNNLYYTLPQSPMCLFAKREKLSSCGIENFLIDLCFHKPDRDLVNKLVTGFKDGVRMEKSTIFNFKAGLR